MSNFKEMMKQRTAEAAVKTIQLLGKLPEFEGNGVITRQLIRCATSVGANYRAACRAKSRADFISKMQTVEEECDEAIYWLKLVHEMTGEDNTQGKELLQEYNEILSIVVTGIKTAKAGRGE